MNISSHRFKYHPQISVSIAYFAAFIGLGLLVASLGPTLSRLADNTQSDLSQISYLFTAKALGFILGSLAGGYIYDRIPGHPIMAAMFFLIALSLSLVPIISVLWLLILNMFLIGIFVGAADVGGNTLLVWLHGQKVQPYMNGLHFFFGLGAALSPIIFAQFLRLTGDVTWGYWTIGLLIIPISFWILCLPSPERPKVHQKTTSKPTMDTYLLLLIITLFFLFVSAEVSLGGWIATYVLESHLADEASAADLTFIFWFSLTIGRLLSIPISTRIHVKYILGVDLLLCLIGVGLILVWPTSLKVIWVGTGIFGLGVASMFPIGISITEKYLTVSGQITSLLFVGGALGGMVIPWLIGQSFGNYEPVSLIWIVLSIVATAICVYGLLMRRI